MDTYGQYFHNSLPCSQTPLSHSIHSPPLSAHSHACVVRHFLLWQTKASQKSQIAPWNRLWQNVIFKKAQYLSGWLHLIFEGEIRGCISNRPPWDCSLCLQQLYLFFWKFNVLTTSGWRKAKFFFLQMYFYLWERMCNADIAMYHFINNRGS